MTTPTGNETPNNGFATPSGEWGSFADRSEPAQPGPEMRPHPQTWADPQPWAESRPWAAEPTSDPYPSHPMSPYGNMPTYGEQPYGAPQPAMSPGSAMRPTYQTYQPTQAPGVQWQQPPSNALQPYAAPYPSPYAHPGMPVKAPRSKVAAALLAWFLGGFGAHNFYLGNVSRAKTQLALYIVGIFTSIIGIGIILMGVVSIWAFIEFIQILIGSAGFDKDADGYPLTT